MQVPAKRESDIVPESGDNNRARLMLGMAAALREKTFAETTIADVVRHARVSKRTFYENFADKEACFLATYEAVSDQVQKRIADAVTNTGGDGEARLAAATSAYFTALEQEPRLTRAFLTDLQAAGSLALKARRKVHQRFADLLVTLVERGQKSMPNVRALSPAMATAVVGAINELVLMKLESGRGQKLSELNEPALELLHAVLSVPGVQRGK